jgi:hypothetical protein
VRVLFDHNLPHKLRTSLKELTEHELVTASYMGWGDLKNGELLLAAEESGFEILITGDQSLCYEQNLSGRHLPQILAAADRAVPGSFQAVECGSFSRKKAPRQ